MITRTSLITTLSAAVLAGSFLLPAGMADAAPAVHPGLSASLASVMPASQTQYLKYSWSPSIYSRTPTSKGDQWKVLSWDDYVSAGYPKPSPAGFIPGTTVYQFPGDSTIFVSQDGLEHALSYPEWKDMGFPSPGTPAKTQYVKYPWGTAIYSRTVSKGTVQWKHLSPADYAKAGRPVPVTIVSLIPDTAVNKYNSDPTLWAEQDGIKHALSFAEWGSLGSPAPTVRTSVEVASFNVDSAWRQKTDPSIPAWDQRVQGVARIINTAKPDVIGIQEAPTITIDTRTYTQADDIRRQTSYEMYQAPDGATMPIPILYRGGLFDRLDAGYKVFENQPYPNYGRAMTWVKLRSKATGDVFFVFNTHLMVGGDKQSVRDNEARMLAAEIRKVNPSGLPDFVTGDFNASASKTAPQTRELGVLGFTDTYSAAADKMHPEMKTHNGYTPPQVGSSRIDQVYAGGRTSDDMRVDYWENWMAYGNQIIWGQQPSDHDMIYTRASFK
ncbi:hypothetical protein IV500_05280 [Paeniglutamicibacter antarcticus]|uniref:Endonuclease/exonuclease/phosphatase domain-containing protein n=1 Tax=Arthrobacter terrae TaxID=2935737 RepID=A0A931CHS5_9MICC|nr:endonuclease/exonuclease/phosphatase family protein [Arthrobacter terrae]MBG0738832.1 hypothetical protein [Arthrobacter terrae]